MRAFHYGWISPEHNNALTVNNLDIWQDNMKTQQIVVTVQHPVTLTNNAQML